MNNLIYKPTHFNNLLYKSYQHVKWLGDFASDEHDGSKERTEVTVYIYGTILRNEIADDYLTTALAQVERTPYYKHSLKKAVGVLRTKKNQYKKVVDEICNTDHLLDCLDNFKEEYAAKIKRQLDVLYYSVQQSLLDQGVQYSNVLANLIMADTLMEISIGRMKVDSKHPMMAIAMKQVSYLRLDPVQCEVQKVIAEFGKHHLGQIDINTQRNIAAVNALSEALRNYNLVLETIKLKDGEG